MDIAEIGAPPKGWVKRITLTDVDLKGVNKRRNGTPLQFLYKALS